MPHIELKISASQEHIFGVILVWGSTPKCRDTVVQAQLVCDSPYPGRGFSASMMLACGVFKLRKMQLKLAVLDIDPQTHRMKAPALHVASHLALPG